MKSSSKKDKHAERRRRLIIVGSIIAVITLYALLNQPERSAASYCKVIREEAQKRDKGATNIDSISILKTSERYAPKDIEDTARKYRQVLETIERDPAQTISASFNGLLYEEQYKAWINTNCGK